MHAKAQVKTSQAVRHFHGPLSKESTTQELLVGAMFHLLVSETCCSCCCAPACWHPQHQGSESDRGYAEAGLAAGICGRALLTGRSASGLFSKEPKQCLCCTDTPSDVLIPSRATAVTGLCWQMLPEHRTSSVRWDATRHTRHSVFSESWDRRRATVSVSARDLSLCALSSRSAVWKITLSCHG